MTDKLSEFWRKTYGWRLPLTGLICFIFALATVLFRSQPPENHAINNPPESPFYKTIGGIGVIEPKSENISIGTEIPGIVRKINVTQNEDVKKGHLLFSLDQRDVDGQIAELEASLVSAKVQHEDAQKYFELVQDIKDYRAVSKEDFDRRKYSAQLNYARVLEIQAQIERAYTTKDRMNIRAPIDGRVLNIRELWIRNHVRERLLKKAVLVGLS
jgi:multidrug efflux pump subunit AcrA (membrane-fusion protein)